MPNTAFNGVFCIINPITGLFDVSILQGLQAGLAADNRDFFALLYVGTAV